MLTRWVMLDVTDDSRGVCSWAEEEDKSEKERNAESCNLQRWARHAVRRWNPRTSVSRDVAETEPTE
jgi:hypothetical protein